jgi:hypothetical protein
MRYIDGSHRLEILEFLLDEERQRRLDLFPDQELLCINADCLDASLKNTEPFAAHHV